MTEAADILRKAKERYHKDAKLKGAFVALGHESSQFKESLRIECFAHLRCALGNDPTAIAFMSREEKIACFDRAIALAEAGKP